MKQLNFIPLSVRQKEAQQQLMPLLVLSAIVGLAALGATYVAVDQQVKSTARETTAAVTTTTSQSSGLDSDTQQRISKINTLAKDDVQWSRAFSLVSSILPKDVRLSTYSITVNANDVTVKMNGSTVSNAAFAEFYESLKTNKTVVTKVTVDGYSFDPLTKSVTFGVTLTVPRTQVDFSAQ